MKRIDARAPIRELWSLFNESSFDPNRVIYVVSNDEVVGIVTDSEIRKFVAKYEKLPQSIADITRRDFVFVEEGASSSEIAISLSEQLRSRKYSGTHPINDVLVVSGSQARLVNLAEFSDSLEKLFERYFVFGLGYVGLTLFALLFSKLPQGKVIGIEIDDKKVERLLAKDYYVLEPGLADFLGGLSKASIVSSLEEVDFTQESSFSKSVFLIAVQTPVNDRGHTSLNEILEASTSIARNLRKNDVVIVRSTVPIGTCRLLAKNIEVISKLKCGEDFYLGFAPERTIEGNALKEIESLPQIVAGYSSACIASVRSIVEMWNSSILTASSLEMAEMVKLSNNAYRDHHFSFANELALIADTHNLDINEVVQLGNLGYSRSNIAIPSLGVGGPCLSKDSYILLSKLEEIENQTRGAIHEEMQIGSTILSARELNRRMPYFVAEKIIKELSNQPKPHIGLAIGMAFKGYPATNDLRNSPAVDAVKILIQNNVEMFCWDYVVASNQLQGYGLQSLPSASSKSRPLPLFCMIGNNHPENILKIRELTNQFETIKKVFDPWDLLRTSGNLEYYIQKGISVFNLSSRISP